MSTTKIPEDNATDPLLGLGLSEGLGPAEQRLREAVDAVMRYQFTHSRPGMHALQVLIDEADDAAYELERLRARVLELEAVHEDASGSVLQERERCAAILERGVDLGALSSTPGWQKYTADLLNACAAMIRAA